jgi:diguanylate cyclase
MEMHRARRESDGLVAAYIDVVGLKALNDAKGHAAGDALLREVADGVRRHMRPYDFFVRLGGDEFLCALPNVTEVEARKRFDSLLGELQESDGSSVTIGYSELRDGDTADDLVSRADVAMLAQRKA